MNFVMNFIIKYKEEIEIILKLLSGFATLFVALLKTFKFIQKRFFSKPSRTSKEAIYLNNPTQFYEKYFNEENRDQLQVTVIKEITGGKKKPKFTNKSIFISGEEGIGKSFFGYRLFIDNLQQHPLYFGWIECYGKESIFDIIGNTFDDPRFYGKSKSKILNAFCNLEKQCILFIDQINQYTPLDELEELSHCSKVILILLGTIRKIDFVNYTHILPPLSDDIICKIFEHYAKEEIDKMALKSKESVTSLLEDYVRGNPFLAILFASVKHCYEDKWENVLKNMQTCEDEDENYFKNVLRKLYRTNNLSNEQKSALSKLSTIQHENFTKTVFDILDISDYCISSLCNLFWLEQKDSVLYSIDKVHCDVISKLFMYEINLEIAIDSINKYLSAKIVKKNSGFRWISLYIESILKRVRGDAVHIMQEEFFYEFACNVANNYHNMENYKKCLEWAKLCKSENVKLAYLKKCIEFQAKYNLVNTLYSPSEVDKAYADALTKTQIFDDCEDKKRFLMQEYCNYLIKVKCYNDAMSLCKEYFTTYSMDFRNKHNCEMYYRYLDVATRMVDIEILEQLVDDTIIQGLYQNEKVSITVAWSFGLLGIIYKKLGDKKTSDIYMRHMVVLLNEQSAFFDSMIKRYLNISEEEFMEYMHSCDELLDSLEQALARKDVDAIYLEGRYQEKQGNYNDAIVLYEEAATRDSLRGMCSLALLYYRGQGISCDYDKARRCWEYCCDRGHRDSYYWLGILLLDTDYKGYNKKVALDNLTKAAELGSERAKQKLAEL